MKTTRAFLSLQGFLPLFRGLYFTLGAQEMLAKIIQAEILSAMVMELATLPPASVSAIPEQVGGLTRSALSAL